MEQVLYGLLDLNDNLGETRRQLAYAESYSDEDGNPIAQNGGGLFMLMNNLYRGWEDSYDNSVYHKEASDSEYVQQLRDALSSADIATCIC